MNKLWPWWWDDNNIDEGDIYVHAGTQAIASLLHPVIGVIWCMLLFAREVKQRHDKKQSYWRLIRGRQVLMEWGFPVIICIAWMATGWSLFG